jgi:hypothetical protein
MGRPVNEHMGNEKGRARKGGKPSCIGVLCSAFRGRFLGLWKADDDPKAQGDHEPK